jgi:hypothetical protein
MEDGGHNLCIMRSAYEFSTQTRGQFSYYEGVSKSFRTESINIRLPLVLLVEKPYKVLWRQNSLDLLTK